MPIKDEWHNNSICYRVINKALFTTTQLPYCDCLTTKNADMETFKSGSHPRPVISQAENNTTLWIGHLQSDLTDHFGGQTFTCPSDGQLDNIQLYASAIQYPGNIQLTVHEFDPETKTWGPSLGETSLEVKK